MGSFFSNVKTEFSKVVWPTGSELKSSTLITIGVTVLFTLFVWGSDTLISMLAQFVYGL